ncbi:glycosyltransferase [Methylocystis heyeri]|uniref:Glycosyltransferase n=2 Tax=Methylocystis heyeri TaxID=391905 RepID=A0A6B8KE72_9HYPH|nr:glycosyltransferase [Methylocystis heyeri]
MIYRLINGLSDAAGFSQRTGRGVFRLSLETLIVQSGLFDANWYILDNHDVRDSGMNPLHHFCAFGDREGRSPGPAFNSAAYAEAWADVASSNMGMLEHYLRIGRDLGRQAPEFSRDFLQQCDFREKIHASGLFDVQWYRDHNPDLRDPSIDVLTHVASFGAKEGRDPGPKFSSLLYSLAYSEDIAVNESALWHYLYKGRDNGFKPFAKSDYGAWAHIFDRIDAEDRDLMCASAAERGFPGIEIVHVFDALACRRASEIFESFQNQVLGRWNARIIFADDVSAADRAAVVARAANEAGISVVADLDEGFWRSLNGKHVLYIHGCVRLEPHAAYMFIERVLTASADIVYSDHDRWNDEGKRSAPRFKPVFSPELLRNGFYVGPCLLMRMTPEKSNLAKGVIEDLRLGGCDRLSDALLAAPHRSVAHIPFVSFSLFDQSPDLVRRRSSAPPLAAATPQPRVSIVIATRDRIELMRSCVDSIEQNTSYPRDRFEIVIVDNGSVSEEARAYFTGLRGRAGYKLVNDPGDFNFSRIYNRGARESGGDILILLNNDMTVIEPRWIDLIVAQCLQADVGAVGAKLLYPDDTIQHAGCNIGVAGLAAHRLVGKKAEAVEASDVTRELAAITGACLGVRRDVFELVGGLDETLRVAFNDTKFCLSCLEQGFRNIYIAKPLLYHFESKSRGLDDTKKKLDLQYRESLYTRRQFPSYFKNDPYYSPNLSVERIDELALPPRRKRPWRSASKNFRPRIMFLCSTLAVGHGVPLIIQMQARGLVKEGFDVIVAGPSSEKEFAFDGCRRIFVAAPLTAAIIAVRENVDCIIVHSPPFYSITRYLGACPIVYFSDAGEPNPELFPDREHREYVNREKRFCATAADRIFAISQAIKDESLDKNVSVMPLGNSHMANWSDALIAPRKAMREKFGWEDKYVVFNVCRFHAGERNYKGIDKYVELMEELSVSDSRARGKAVFVLAGKAHPDDVAEMKSLGLTVFPNVSEELLLELYAASDLYANFSKWEGYNLGIAQALAMGLPVIASDIPAHREFPINTTDSMRVAIEKLTEAYLSFAEGKSQRRPVIYDWEAPVSELVQIIRADMNVVSEQPAGQPPKNSEAMRDKLDEDVKRDRPERWGLARFFRGMP